MIVISDLPSKPTVGMSDIIMSGHFLLLTSQPLIQFARYLKLMTYKKTCASRAVGGLQYEECLDQHLHEDSAVSFPEGW